MIEATEIGRSQEPSRAVRPFLLRDRLDDLVGDRVAAPGERLRQGLAIGSLIGAGLLGVVASLVLAVVGTGVPAIVAPLCIAGLCLGAAAYLSLTGAFGHVIWLVWTAVVIGLGYGLTLSPDIGAAGLALFAVVPLESLRLKKRVLTAGLSASSAAGVAALCVLAPAQFSMTAAAALPIAVSGLYLASLVLRQHVVVGPAPLAASETLGGRHGACSLDEAAELFGVAMMRLTFEGRIVGVSAAASAMLVGDGHDDCARTDFDGKALLDLVHVADRVAFLQGIDRTRSGERIEARTRLRQANGLYLECRIHLSMVPPTRNDEFADGDLSGGRAANGEIVVRIEDASPAGLTGGVSALEQALDAANQSSAAKSHFLAAVSHELRTPLNAIIGFSDILHHEFFGGFETERQKEYVGLIRQSGQHLLSVVNGLLDVSKIEAGRYELSPEPLVVSEVMALAAGVMRDEAIGKNLRLDIRLGCRDASIVADRQACHQILLNLLSNAVKFTDVGVVTLESRLLDGAIEMSVCDTGIGIPPEDVKRLGLPFVQVSSGHARRYQGTGLGLSLVKGLAELHGGALTIHSQPKIGTKVTVRLPLDCTQPGDPSLILKKNVVALNDARTKTHPIPQIPAARRTA